MVADGDFIVSIWTDGGLLLTTQNVVSVPGTWVNTPLAAPLVLFAGTTYRVGVHMNNVDYYASIDLPGTFADGTINQGWVKDGDAFPTIADNYDRWWFVDLGYAPLVLTVPASPVVSGNFTNGVWSGTVAVLQPAANVALQASAGTGHSGLSVPFNVLALPKLAIAVGGNTVVLSWPTTVPAGFTLQQSSDMINWSVVPLTPAVVGSNYDVTNSIGTGGVYYRLQKP